MTYLAGQKLRANDLRRIVARHRRTTSTAATSGTTGATAGKVCELSAPLLAGRLYRIGAASVGVYANFGSSNSIVEIQLTYTTNGAVPAVTSPQLVNHARAVLPGGFVEGLDIEAFYAPATNQTIRVLMSFYLSVAGGASSAGVFSTAAWPIDFVIEDIGADPGSTGVNF